VHVVCATDILNIYSMVDIPFILFADGFTTLAFFEVLYCTQFWWHMKDYISSCLMFIDVVAHASFFSIILSIVMQR